MKKKVLVLGGGASGLGVAWKLAENQIPVEVIESKVEIGGLAATVIKEGRFLDYGPHYFLSERPEIVKKVTSLFKEEFGRDMFTFKRNAKLMFHGRFLNYPPNIKNILFDISIIDSFLIGISYFYRQLIESMKRLFLKNRPIDNFEDWARINFGDYLFKIFFKPYTEQFWGIKCNKLAPKTLPTNTQLSFLKTLKIVSQRKVTKKNISLAEREITLLLHYPPKGIGMVMQAIGSKIKKLGGRVHLGYIVKEIKRNSNGTFTVTTEHKKKIKKFHADFVISTIPLPLTIETLRPTVPRKIIDSLKRLDFLSVIVVYFVIPNRKILSSDYLYFVGRPYNRISEINKFSSEMCAADENMLGVEISCRDKEDIWKYNEKQLFEYCIKPLEKDNIITREEVKRTFVLRARYAYPIFFKDYAKYLSTTLDYLCSIPNFWVTGRGGKYLYEDVDQCLIDSFNLIDKILPKLKYSSKT